MRAQSARASPESPRIQTVIRADPRKADNVFYPLAGRALLTIYFIRNSVIME
jgi:hypothetical protein